MKNIKKLYILLSSVAVALSLTGCYKDYVQDFDYSGAYLAYQYDLLYASWLERECSSRSALSSGE